MAIDWQEDNQTRLSAAMKAASTNPEKLLIEAATAGDTKTLHYLLTRDINCPGHYGTENGYIALKPAAYQRAFDAAAKGFQGGAVNVIISRAPDRVTDFSMASAVFRALFANPEIYPEAELLIKTVLDKKPESIPYEIRETAKRLVHADDAQKKHLRSHLHDYLAFYANKKCYIEIREHRKQYPAPLMNSFGKGNDKAAEKNGKKELPPYLRLVK
ncbi:MAG: hypothetical protein EP349_06685 [Alphaproteobacteria bacterium]|nr:MAG: hypothetical protein EP349_06685 [Alphaproteobacteria bacterium]